MISNQNMNLPLYYIKAKTIVRVAGISGPFEQIHSGLVRGGSLIHAKERFEQYVKERCSNMVPERIIFEYIETAGEI